MEQITSRLAKFIFETSVPLEVVDKANECLIDFVGITAFAAANAESSGPVRAGIRSASEGTGHYTVVGDHETWTQSDAALLNGTYAHSLDFDDTHGRAALHPGAPVIAATIGWTEADPVLDGRQWLEAIAIGSEVAVRVGLALNTQSYVRGFHPTAIAGIFGAVAAGCRMIRADPQIVESALGLAGSLAAGSMQYMESGAWNKRLHPGFAARNSILALRLAAAGVEGAAGVLEGRYGCLNGYAESPDPDAVVRGLGIDWESLDTALKPFPSCRATHCAIEAALLLRKKAQARGITAPCLRLVLKKRSWGLVAERTERKLRPRSIVDAQFSVFFQVACAWIDGEFTWDSYRKLGDPDIETFAARMDVVIDDTLPMMSCRMSIDGTDLAVDVIGTMGERNNPLTPAVVESKFLSMTEPVYGQPASNLLLAALRDVAAAPSASDVVKRMRREQ